MIVTFKFQCYIEFMKKFLCRFLMLWLPLFMQSAWAMSTHMALDAVAIETIHIEISSPTDHCHPSKKIATHQKSSNHHQSCGHCVVCAMANASASFRYAFTFSSSYLSQTVPIFFSLDYLSTTLPHAYKPPILN